MNRKVGSTPRFAAMAGGQGQVLIPPPTTAKGFASLHKTQGEAVKAYLLRRGAPWGTVEDLTQEVFLRAWNERRGYDARKGPAVAWLLGIAQNLVYEWRRKRRVVTRPKRDVANADAPAAQVLDERESARALRRAVAQLPPKQRAAIELVYFKRLKTAEAAVKLGCAQSVLRRRLTDARKHLREKLRKFFISHIGRIRQ